MLTPAAAEASARLVFEVHRIERDKLDIVRRFFKGRQRLPAVIPVGSPREVRVMAASSRVNVMPIVVNSLVQASRVDGIRGADGPLEDVWKAWQGNKLDSRQTAIYRAAAQYGVAYTVVLPGKPYPVIRSVSPRSMATLYSVDNPDWPTLALERMRNGRYRLYDATHVYELSRTEDRFTYVTNRVHGAEVGAPVVRFLDEIDDDDDDEPETHATAMPGQQETTTRGQVAPLMGLQDQIDLTTFALQIATHYAGSKQRYIIGWAADNEAAAIKAGASTLITLDEDPANVKFGEFAQSDLDGFIKSREASLKHSAALSQTPVHELTADVIQMSAEALAASEAGKERKAEERHVIWGEAHEQELWLASKFMGIQEVPVDAQVVWRDTSARSFAATVDALGKLSSMLGVPPQELWERIPGVTQQDVARFKQAAQQGDAFDRLTSMLDQQAAGVPAPEPAPANA